MMTRRIELSPRLRLAADLVPKGARLADVGTDHAYLPACLLMEGKIPSAIAADLREGPLSRARETAAELDIPLREGVYFYCYGPQYETPAEIRAARILGGDAVGMSTAPEVIVAGHCGMEVLGLTLLSNMAAGILDQPLSEQEVLDAAAAAREKFSGLIRACLKKM